MGFTRQLDLKRTCFSEEIGMQALDSSGVKKEAINSVEIVGSSSRVPALLQLMREVFDKEPSRTLNAKECVSRGCALNCAMLSPIFRWVVYAFTS